MQCPDCAHEVDDAAVFCPWCRFQFREIADSDPLELEAEDTLFEDETTRFSKKELKQLEIQLLQPAFFLALFVSAGLYFLVSPLQMITISIAGLSIAPGAGITLLIGLGAGLIFFYTIRHSLRKFRA